MKPGLYYLCIPYQGSEEHKAQSAALSLKAVIQFLRQGVHVFAPVLYVNTISEAMEFSSIEERREVIMPYLTTFLKASQGVILITLEGWTHSWGVKQTLVSAYAQQVPIYTLSPEKIEGDVSVAFSSPLDRAHLLALVASTS